MDPLKSYDKEIRPWGSFERFTLNEKSTVKIITVLPNESFSLQKHSHRSEFWKIISGTGVITIGDDKRNVLVGDEMTVPPETEHRVEAGDKEVIILEIAFGEFDENDIERIEDKYGRA